MSKIKIKKENSIPTYLKIACSHLMGNLKSKKIHEVIIKGESTFMCPKCYKEDRMQNDIKDGNIDNWFSVCKNCIYHEFKNIETEIIE